MAILKGITVYLISKQVTGKDAFNRPITEDVREAVDNVLVAPISQTDVAVVNELSLSGKKARYWMASPKGDTHQWEDAEVEFFNSKWKTVGYATEGIESLIPLDWNRKVVVEKYG